MQVNESNSACTSTARVARNTPAFMSNLRTAVWTHCGMHGIASLNPLKRPPETIEDDAFAISERTR